jgi:hypothetical protein
MRSLFLTAIVTAGLWAVDGWAFNGRFRKDAWQQANNYGAMFKVQVHHLLKRLD